jgi:hypothetical protein
MEILRSLRSPHRSRHMSPRALRTFGLTVATVALSACATGRGAGRADAITPSVDSWPVVTREYVDLWLHGYAMLTRDAAQVPVFRRGYRDSIEAVRHRANVLTGLDANHANLALLMTQNPEISNGQFVPLYFTSWDQIVQASGAFVDGGALGGATPADRRSSAILGSMYPTVQDREWLRLFTQSLGDESAHFYHQYWMAQEEARRSTVVAVDSLWRAVRPRFQRFLTNTGQTDGQLVLSLVLGGEGRTMNAAPQQNIVVVTMPESAAGAAEAIYVFAHEVVQVVSNQAVNDNTTAAQQRSGDAAGFSPTAAVRGGAMLLQHVAPELADGFMRYYLTQAGRAAPAGNPEATFVAAFPLPTAILADMERQIGGRPSGI